MAERDKNGKWAKGHSPSKPKGAIARKTVELEQLRQKLLSAMDLSEIKFKEVFDKILEKEPATAIKLIQNMFPKDFKISNDDDTGIKIVFESIQKPKK